MERLRKISRETQGKNFQEQESVCKIIVEQLEKQFNTKITRDLPDGKKITYLNIITTFLLLPDFVQYRQSVVELLKQYNVNQSGLLLHILGVINQIKPGYTDSMIDERRNMMIKTFSTLPYYENVFWDDKIISLKTNYGNIKVFRYDRFIKDERIKMLVRTIPFATYCHYAASSMKRFYKDGYITTSEVPLLFGGYMYHSYITTSEGVVDIAYNTFYPENSFNEIFSPTEILKIKSSEFESEYKRFLIEEDIIEDKMDPVLALAINNKRKNM